jgi:hypothetical protein
MDPHWFGSLNPDPEVKSWIRSKATGQNLQMNKKSDSEPSKRLLYLRLYGIFYDLLTIAYMNYNFHVKIQLLLTKKSDPHPDPEQQKKSDF